MEKAELDKFHMLADTGIRIYNPMQDAESFKVLKREINYFSENYSENSDYKDNFFSDYLPLIVISLAL